MFYCTLSHSIGKSDKEPNRAMNWTEKNNIKKCRRYILTLWHNISILFHCAFFIYMSLYREEMLKKTDCTDSPTTVYLSINFIFSSNVQNSHSQLWILICWHMLVSLLVHLQSKKMCVFSVQAHWDATCYLMSCIFHKQKHF